MADAVPLDHDVAERLAIELDAAEAAALDKLGSALRARDWSRVASIAGSMDGRAKRLSGSALQVRDASDVFTPLPPVPWLCEAIDACPGAPVLLAGYGFSGKTVAAQALALAVATRGRAWGDLELQRRGRVVHVDYEQGFRLTAERYQRLARPLGIEAGELRGRLGLASLATVTLSSPQALDAYKRAAEGAALLIVDSLRASAPDVDENSSEVRRLLDTLCLVSEATGAVPLVIHHARKPGGEDHGARFAVRGSSAIFDACSSVLVFSATKGEPTVVSHEKARTSGVCSEDVHLVVEDVERGGDPRWGLRVRALPSEALAEKQAARLRRAHADLDEKVEAFVADNPGASLRAVRAGVPDGRASDRDASLDRLVRLGRLREEPGPRGARLFHPLRGGTK